MKNTIILLLTSVFSFHGISQGPEKIYGNARQHKSISYYKGQKAVWKRVVDEHPKDANAWYNYYYVNRNLMFNDTTGELSPKEYNTLITKIVDEMEKQVPNSYEFNLCKWQISGFDQKALPYLRKAAEMGEGRVEHLDFMINQAEMNRELKERDLHSLKRFEAGQFSTGIIYYNYNVLVGLEKNTILITSGDNDTYPVWLLQAQGIRKDVTVINMSLIQLEYYREKVFAELEIEKWQKPANNEMTSTDHERFLNGIIEHISANKKHYPVSVALTTACDDKYTKTIQQNLYLTGLAYLFSPESIDNMAHLKKNMEQLYALDYLDKHFYHEISPDMVKIINGNYLVPLLTLYDHYKLSGDEQRKDWTKSKLMLISKGTENEEEVLKHLTKIK